MSASAKLPAHLVVLDDVGLQVDVVPRAADRGEHGLVGGRAVLQQDHLVADHQRAADDGLLERQVAVEDAGLLARGSRAGRGSPCSAAADSGPRAPSSCTGAPGAAPCRERWSAAPRNSRARPVPGSLIFSRSCKDPSTTSVGGACWADPRAKSVRCRTNPTRLPRQRGLSGRCIRHTDGRARIAQSCTFCTLRSLDDSNVFFRAMVLISDRSQGVRAVRRLA